MLLKLTLSLTNKLIHEGTPCGCLFLGKSMDNSINSTSQNDINSKNVKTIFTCWTEAIRRFFDINGRTTRYEFWAFQTVSLLIFVAAAFVGLIFGIYKIIFEIYTLYFLIPATTISVRRLHDLGQSGKLVIPAVIFALLMLISWEMNWNGLLIFMFLCLSYMTYLYAILTAAGSEQINIYGSPVKEAKIYTQDSQVFIFFMAAFLVVLWLIFIIRLF